MDILFNPIVSEKMTSQADKLHCFGFIVDKRANKLQIKKAVEEMYGVTVISVNTMRYEGKLKTKFTKSKILKGNTNSFKKAIIKLAAGETIDFYSNI